MSARARTLARQALVNGQVRLPAALVPPGASLAQVRAPLELRLRDRTLPGEPDLPLDLALTADGRFAFHGDPDTAFPRLATEAAQLRVEARAPRHDAVLLDVDFGPSAGQPQAVDVPVPLETPARPRLFTGGGLPVSGLDLEMTPQPVRLEGRVVISNQPDDGIAGALVALDIGVDTTTASDGSFSFAAPLPVVRTVEATVTATDFVTRETTHELAYDQPVNRLIVLMRAA